ncbi:pentapeptide repeat-containing protein, partial [Salmonella enterica subsp. enterica serovar Kentucky]|nr:pentapeptide repeat-containing protein [Salmonella enterica subsp. enterica serovar Kentucky]
RHCAHQIYYFSIFSLSFAGLIRYTTRKIAIEPKAVMEYPALFGANLCCANLHAVNLMGSNMTKANLTHADLTCANMSGVNLTAA